MSAGAPVDVQMRFTEPAVALLQNLTEEAIRNAIQRTIARITNYAKSALSPVPIDTGRLRSSFDIGSTPRSIVFRWSAIDPRTGFDYAKVQDEGRANMVGKFYSDVVKMYARMWLVEELRAELMAIGSVP